MPVNFAVKHEKGPFQVTTEGSVEGKVLLYSALAMAGGAATLGLAIIIGRLILVAVVVYVIAR
jgi:hypothetical protein